MQALVLLMVARALVALVPMRYWRRSLGVIVPCTPAIPTDAGKPALPVPPALRQSALAVNRAVHRLPLHMKCLPQAMATQWMARARGIACTLRIGIERQSSEEPLHAWIDWHGVTVIGRRPGRTFTEILALAPLPDQQNTFDRTL